MSAGGKNFISWIQRGFITVKHDFIFFSNTKIAPAGHGREWSCSANYSKFHLVGYILFFQLPNVCWKCSGIFVGLVFKGSFVFWPPCLKLTSCESHICLYIITACDCSSINHFVNLTFTRKRAFILISAITLLDFLTLIQNFSIVIINFLPHNIT